jgi:hypothetical protein
MSKRNGRNHVIEALRKDKEITNTEASFMFIVSDLLGEDETIDIDLDEISEATGVADTVMCIELLSLMHNSGVVDVNHGEQTISEPME